MANKIFSIRNKTYIRKKVITENFIFDSFCEGCVFYYRSNDSFYPSLKCDINEMFNKNLCISKNRRYHYIFKLYKKSTCKRIKQP